ncbi:uncharacterized protein ACR2FA_008141 [Aphomia sociella]
MYRYLFALLICTSVTPAPQDNSDITYVKIQPLPGDPLLKPSARESRIEILPLSIGGNTQTTWTNSSEELITNADVQIVKDEFRNQTNKATNFNQTINDSGKDPGNDTDVKTTTLSDHSIDAAIIHKLNRISSEDPTRITSTESHFESNQHDKRFARNDYFSTTNYETDSTDVTEKVELPTVAYEARTKPPRYISKLSYFHKSSDTSGLVNLVESGGKKRFRSRCRCEKIWNCPKLQITVPRCPNEYFLCCF